MNTVQRRSILRWARASHPGQTSGVLRGTQVRGKDVSRDGVGRDGVRGDWAAPSTRLTFAAVVLIAFLTACGVPTGDAGLSVVDLTLQIPTNAVSRSTSARAITDPSVAQNVLIRVTAAEMDTIEEVVTRDSTDAPPARVDLEVPAGRNRTFEAFARNFENTVLYSGKRTIDLRPGSTIRIGIVLTEVRQPSTDAAFSLTRVHRGEGVIVYDDIEPDSSDSNVLRLLVPIGTDLTGLTPDFTASQNATVSVTHFPPSAPVGPSSAQTIDNIASEQELLNFAGPVVFTTVSEDGENTTTTTVYTYYADAVEGATGAESAGIYVQDPVNDDTVLMDDFVAGTGVFVRKTDTELSGIGQSADIDFDAFGSTYIATFSSVTKFESHLSVYAGTGGIDFGSLGESIDFITVDRVRDRLYYTYAFEGFVSYVDAVSQVDTGPVTTGQIDIVATAGANNQSQLTTTDIEGTDQFPGTHALGVAVDEEGYVYVVTEATDTTNYTILKIDPSVPSIVDGLDLDAAAIGFVPDYSDGVEGSDLLYREGKLYLLNDVDGQGSPAVMRFSTDPLAFEDSFGEGVADPWASGNEIDTTNGLFLGPRRFAAVLNKRIVIIDEGVTNGAQDRLVFFDGFSGSTAENWGVYGTSGSGTDQFQFFTSS